MMLICELSRGSISRLECPAALNQLIIDLIMPLILDIVIIAIILEQETVLCKSVDFLHDFLLELCYRRGSSYFSKETV